MVISSQISNDLNSNEEPTYPHPKGTKEGGDNALLGMENIHKRTFLAWRKGGHKKEVAHRLVQFKFEFLSN